MGGGRATTFSARRKVRGSRNSPNSVPKALFDFPPWWQVPTGLSATQPNSPQLNSTQLRSISSTRLDSTQLSSAQLNSTQLNSTQLNSNPLNSTRFEAATQLNSTQLDLPDLAGAPDVNRRRVTYHDE